MFKSHALVISAIVALLTTTSTHCFAAPAFELRTFEFTGWSDRIKVDASGQYFMAPFPSAPGYFYASDVNSAGVAAGVCGGGLGANNAACIFDSASQVVTAISSPTSGAHDINEVGEILWGPQDPRTGNQTTHLLIRRNDGTDEDLGFTSYWRPSFNIAHDVVGRLYGGLAFYFYEGVRYDLESLVGDLQGLRELSPTDLNDQGYIGGWAFFGQDVRGFVLAPTGSGSVPEPGTLALAVIALGLAVRRRRCRQTIGLAEGSVAKRLALKAPV